MVVLGVWQFLAGEVALYRMALSTVAAQSCRKIAQVFRDRIAIPPSLSFSLLLSSLELSDTKVYEP